MKPLNLIWFMTCLVDVICIVDLQKSLAWKLISICDMHFSSQSLFERWIVAIYRKDSSYAYNGRWCLYSSSWESLRLVLPLRVDESCSTPCSLYCLYLKVRQGAWLKLASSMAVWNGGRGTRHPSFLGQWSGIDRFEFHLGPTVDSDFGTY